MISASDRPRSLAVLLAAVLVGSLVAPAAFAGSTAAAPAGMATIPDANVAEEVPAGESIPLDAADLQAGRVMASDHADSLDVILTTPDRAATIMGTDSAAISGNGMAVVLRDNEHSSGRRVALDAGRLQDALGYQPEAIYGTHEDGSEWTATAEYIDGYLVFDVPHFSTNTVTFSGEVRIDATEVTNNTQFEYVVANDTSVRNSEMIIKGDSNTRKKELVRDNATLSTTIKINTGGNAEPDDGKLKISANQIKETQLSHLDQATSSTNLDFKPITGDGESIDGGTYYYESTFGISPSKSGKLTEISPNIHDTGGTLAMEIKPVGGSYQKLVEWTPSSNGRSVVNVNNYTVSKDTDYKIHAYPVGSTSAENEFYYDTNNQDFTGSNLWDIGYTVNAKQPVNNLSVSSTKDSLDIKDLSYGDSVTRSIKLSSGSDNITFEGTSNNFDYNLSWTSKTITNDPSVTISSDAGSQTIDYQGKISDGSSVDLSDEINEALIGGLTTISVNVDNPSSDPSGQLDFDFLHSAQDKISTTYEASAFEEKYNVSHTYAEAVENARVTIPFASSRVVGVKKVEYRVDDGPWTRLRSENYRFVGTTIDVYLADATGGVEAGQTVDVRATGRKVTVDNGKVTITDPTRPGDDLDTQLQIDSRSDDFALNVGPTDDGRRVHYATSNDYRPEDYVVIQANGDQDLHLPNSVSGDRFRVQHLKTKVEPKQGDVRIDVLKAGSNPELDVSPGPGGAGDPVDFEYYRTESGAEYILKSLTDSIVRDSDVAQSPAIFEDDDSDETLAITLDSVASTASQTGGAVGGAVAGAGQFAADQATGLLGMISLPVDGSPILWLLGLVGLGFVVFRTDLLSGSGDGLDDAGEAAGGLTRTAGRAVSGAGSGILAGLRGLLGYFGEIAAVILSNRRATIVATILLAISLSAAGVIPITEDVAILLVISGIPIASYIGLRSNGLFSQRVWLASTAIATLVGVELVAPGTLQIAIEQLTSEAVAPLLILLVGGAAYLYYRTRQAEASTPGTVIRTVIGNDDGND